MDRILLIEDDPALGALYKELFEKEGYNFTLATDGEQGFKIAINTLPDLILLDILLPKMNGMTILDQIRKTDWGKNEPIIMLTNVDQNDMLVKSEPHERPTYYFVKANTTPGEVLEKVKEVLASRKI